MAALGLLGDSGSFPSGPSWWETTNKSYMCPFQTFMQVKTGLNETTNNFPSTTKTVMTAVCMIDLVRLF